MATEAYVSVSGGTRRSKEPADVPQVVANIIAAETRHAPLSDELLVDLDWLAMLSILTAVEDELHIQIFPDFAETTVQHVLAPLETTSDIVELVERLLNPSDSAGPTTEATKQIAPALPAT